MIHKLGSLSSPHWLNPISWNWMMNNQTSGPQDGKRKITFLMKCGHTFYDKWGSTYENIDRLEYIQCASMDFCVSTSSTFVTLSKLTFEQIGDCHQLTWETIKFLSAFKSVQIYQEKRKKAIVTTKFWTLYHCFTESLGRLKDVKASLIRPAFILSLSTGPPILLTR